MPINEQARKEKIQQAIEALPVDHDSLRIPWRGENTRIPIIRLAIDATVLNPKSHRIRSQLESDPALTSAVQGDPEGDVAQTGIADLLRETKGFEGLKQNLHDDGQNQPGIITANGRLINANRRAVALSDLGQEYLEVGVLPTDASIGETYDLELDLQVAQDFREEYSFTNDLLFIEDLITEQNRTEREIAIGLRWSSPSKEASVRSGIAQVQRYVRHLDLIRDIQQQSSGQIPLTEFDDDEQALKEFDAAYQGLRSKDLVAAQQLKQARILGLFVDLGYDPLRQVDKKWVEQYLQTAFEADDLLNKVIQSVLSTEGPSHPEPNPQSDLDEFEDLDEADVQDELPIHRAVNILVQRLGESAQQEQINLPTLQGEVSLSRDQVREAVNDAMRVAADDARLDKKAGNALQLPVLLVDEAAKRLTKAGEAYERVANHEDLDAAKIEVAIAKVERSLEALRIRMAE